MKADPLTRSSTTDAPKLGGRLAASIMVVIAILAGVNAIDASAVGVFYDDAQYVILGKAIATGGGYRFINLPGEPAATHFPPGYPALLALLWRISPSFPENVALFRMVNALLLGVVAFWMYWIPRRLLHYGVLTSSFVALASTVTIPTLVLSSNVLSETLFLALLLPFLMLSQESSTRAGFVRATLLGLGAAFLTLIRSHGIVLLPAVVALYLLRRRWREATAAAGAGLIALLPWLLWVARHDGQLASSIRGQYGSYSGWFLAGLQSDGARMLLATIRQNLATIYDVLARSFSLAPLPLLDALAVTAVCVLILAGAIDLARRWKAAVIFLGLYMVLVLVWPFSPLRFVWGVWPLLVLLIVDGACFFWTATSFQSVPIRVRRIIAATACALALIGGIAFNIRGYANSWWATVSRSIGPRIQPHLLWAAQHTNPDDVIAAADDGAIYLYTGRKAVPVSAFTAQQYVTNRTPEENAADLAAIVETFAPKYVMAWAIPTQQAATLLARRSSPLLVPLDTIPGGFVLRRVGIDP